MRNKILAGVVLALGLYLYWDTKSDERSETKKNIETALFDFKADQIKELDFMRGEQKLKLVKVDTGWKITEPFQDDADSGVVDTFVETIAKEKYMDVAREGADIDYKIYGLDKPNTIFTVKNNAGESITYEISGQTNFEKNSLLHKKDSNKVLVASTQWQDVLKKSSFDFRDQRLFRGRLGSILTVEILKKNGNIRLNQKDGKWFLVDQPNLKLDQNRVREILTMLNETKATEFTLSKTPSGGEISKYGFNQSLVKIKLGLTEGSWEAQLATAPNKKLYAWVAKPAFVLELDSAQLDKFKNITVNSLRDKKLPFDFDSSKVTQIFFHTPLKEMTFKKVGDTWPDSPELSVLLGSFKNLVAAEFVPKNDAILQKKMWTAVFSDKDAKEIAKFSWGEIRKEKIDGKDAQYYPMRSSLWSGEDLLIEEIKLKNLPFDKVMNKTEPEKKTK